jgi:hypothetical protein
MAKFADRVKETTSSTGTGAIGLAGAVDGFRSFASALDNGDMVPYVIEAGNGSDWETGLGIFATGSPATLTRTTVTASSNAGSAIDLPAGQHTVYLGMIARTARDIDYTSPATITGATSMTAAGAVGRHHVCSGTTADYEVDLPTSGLAVGDLVSIEMSGALTNLVTIDAGASALIDGERYRVLWARESCVLKWDGTAWTKVAGRGRPMFAHLANNASNNVEAPNTTVTKVPANNNLGAAVSSMVDVSTGKINIVRPGKYFVEFNATITGNNSGTGQTAFTADLFVQPRVYDGAVLIAYSPQYGRTGAVNQYNADSMVTRQLAAGASLELKIYPQNLGSAQSFYIYCQAGRNFIKIIEAEVW